MKDSTILMLSGDVSYSSVNITKSNEIREEITWVDADGMREIKMQWNFILLNQNTLYALNNATWH